MTKTISKKRKTSVKLATANRGESPRFILLGPSAAWASQFPKRHSVSCRSLAQIEQALRLTSRNSLWIASHSELIDQLIRVMSREVIVSPSTPSRLGTLLTMDVLRSRAQAILKGYFESVIGADSSFRLLPKEQLAEVLSSPQEQARDLLIGGIVDIRSGALALVRGDLSRVNVPLSIFSASGTSKPDFRRFEINDYGQTVRFGNYEAGADFILYALDPEYRTRINAKRREQEQGFGASLRRLRNLRRLARDSFGGVAAKTIARIERGEVEKPRGRTLEVICTTLEVAPNDIEGY